MYTSRDSLGRRLMREVTGVTRGTGALLKVGRTYRHSRGIVVIETRWTLVAVP